MTTLGKNGLVQFSFYRPGAKSVALAADFTRWAAGALTMRPQGDGWWTAAMPLPGGEYRFRYVADGVWYTDYASYGVESSKLGGWNSVLFVPEPEAHETPKNIAKMPAPR